MFIPSFERRLLVIVALLALVGPPIDSALESAIEDGHKKQLIDYICRVAEPRLQAGAFREVQDYLISSTNYFGPRKPQITLEEGAKDDGPDQAFTCRVAGRTDVRIHFAFPAARMSPKRFAIAYGLAFLILLTLVAILRAAVRRGQSFATDLYQSWLVRELKLDSLGIADEPRRQKRWLSWNIDSSLVTKINTQIASLQHAIQAQSNELAERRVDSAIGQMAQQIAHDIRSPLSALNLAVSSLREVPPSSKKLLDESVKRIGDIANELNVKRRELEQGTEHVAQDAVRLLDLARALVEEKRMEYSERTGVTLRADLAAGEDVVVQGNAPHLARALSNLVNNAVEAIEGEGEVRVSSRLQSSLFVLTIMDTGKGIPAELLAQIGTRGLTAGKNGSGLGVAHAKQTVEACGGSLAIQSKVGRGTLVTLTFPTGREGR